MIKLKGLKVPLDYDKKILSDIAAKCLQVNVGDISDIVIEKRDVNNSDKKDVHFVIDMSVSLTVSELPVYEKVHSKQIYIKEEEKDYKIKKSMLKKRPVVAGFGPAGMFAALTLAKAGACPIVLERGSGIEKRKEKVALFWKTGVLDPLTNVQFGEGGAGTFSDGKLKVGQKNPMKKMILNELVKAGAPEEILYLSKPHVGTDKLSGVVKNIRQSIINLGGQVLFDAKVIQILQKEGKVYRVIYESDGNLFEIDTDKVILAIGHSARDTFEYLCSCGICMEQKPFGVGVRIEHPQSLIDKIQYGSFGGHPAIGAADYRMVVHLPDGHNVYTFCMCPGGSVVCAASEEERLTTNGMSLFNRDGANANTALLVTVGKEDLKDDHPLSGMAFQRQLERAAFNAGGGGFKAPVQRLEDFMNNCNSTAFGQVLPTYKPGTTFAKVDDYLPVFVTESLRQGIKEMGDWMKGWYLPDALLTGAEVRSTSPVRIVRNESLQAVSLKGLYPCGEGGGYAGGIISAAADGVMCAEKVLE